MEDNNVVGLVEAKKDFTKRLIDILKPQIHAGIKSLYEASVRLCQENDSQLDSLFVFQKQLSAIPRWSQQIVTEEYEKIQEATNCDWLDKLITTTLAAHAKILTIVNNRGKSNKKVVVKIPKPEFFLHKCYIQSAREFWKYPYLFSNKVNSCDYQRNMRDSENIIAEAIHETIRVQLPFKHFLQESLQEDYESGDENIEDPTDSSHQNNLRKLVKRELDNLTKKHPEKDELRDMVMKELNKLGDPDNLDDEQQDAKEEKVVEEKVEDKVVEDRVAENKVVEDKVIEDKVEEENVEDKVVEDKVVENKVVEDKVVEDKVEEKVKEEKVEDKVEEKVEEEKSEEEKSEEKVEEKVKEKPVVQTTTLTNVLDDEMKRLEEELVNSETKLNKDLNDLDELEELEALTNVDDLKPAIDIFGSPSSFKEEKEETEENKENNSPPDIEENFEVVNLPTSPVSPSFEEAVDNNEEPNLETDLELHKDDLDDIKNEVFLKMNDDTVKLDESISNKTKTDKKQKKSNILEAAELPETDNEISESELPVSDDEDELDLGLEDLESKVVSFGSSNETGATSSKSDFKFFNDAHDEEN